MKRRVLKLGLLVLAGAIVNVAVAWGICTIQYNLRIDRYWNNDELPFEVASHIRNPLVFQFEVAPRIDVETFAGGTNWVLIYGADPFTIELSVEAGLPLTVLHGVHHSQVSRSGVFNRRAGIVRVANPDSRIRGMPYLPIWPGFAINTIFYAGILWLLVAAPFKLRRFIRMKRQRCPGCGYPVGTSPVCTECGVPVTPTSEPPTP